MISLQYLHHLNSGSVTRKSKTNRDFMTHVFLRLRKLGGFLPDFLLMPLDIFLRFDWLLRLLRFRFFRTANRQV